MFFQAAENSVADLFIPVVFQPLSEGGRLCANKGVLETVLGEMRVVLLKRGLSRLTSDCTMDSVSGILIFAPAGEVHQVPSGCVGWFLYDNKGAPINSVSEWQTKSFKRDLRADSLSRVVLEKAVLR